MRININRLIIGQNVESISGKMFYNFQGDSPSDKRCIKTVVCYATVPPIIDEDCFTGKCYLYSTLYVPNRSLELYREAENWKNFATIVGFDHGDVDGNGNVNIADVVLLIDIILSRQYDDAMIINYDVDFDGEVTIGDIVALIDMILGI